MESNSAQKMIQMVLSGKIWLPFGRKQWCSEHLVPHAMFHHGWSQVWAPVTADVGNIVLWDIFTKWGSYVSHYKAWPPPGSVHIKQQFFSVCDGGLPGDCSALSSFCSPFSGISVSSELGMKIGSCNPLATACDWLLAVLRDTQEMRSLFAWKEPSHITVKSATVCMMLEMCRLVEPLIHFDLLT